MEQSPGNSVIDLWHSPESNFTASSQSMILYNEFEKCTFKYMFICIILPRTILVKPDNTQPQPNKI